MKTGIRIGMRAAESRFALRANQGHFRTAALAALCSWAALWIQAFAAAPPRPNVIFIMADDLGYTDLGCYGSRYYESPAIDRMAQEGMRFTSGYTAGPNCQPTRAALMSGQHTARTGVYTVGSIERFNWRSRPLRPVDNVVALDPKTVTIAEALQQAGYKTALFGKWHLGEDAAHHPLAQGFDEAIVSAGRHFDFVTRPKVDSPPGTYLADFLTDKAVDFIRRHKDKPFFLCLHHFAVHSPHQAKSNLVARFQNKPAAGGHNSPVYAAMIASVDESVGRVLATLQELNLASNTLVIFTSDNGGVGGYAREGIQGGSITDNAPLRGGKGMLYEGGIRVPYIFWWPGKIQSAATCDEPIHSVDLYPTLLELAGAKPPAKQPLDGMSYADLLLSGGRSTRERKPLFWHFPGYLGAGGGTWRTTPVGVIRSGDWKLMEFFEDGHLELYNLRADIGEKNNVAFQEQERAVAMHQQLLRWRKEIGAPMPTPNAESGGASPPTERGKTRAGRAARKGNTATTTTE
ncbi:MAG: sulfatase [Verrucomicrobiae bacterium]|nr:sulfatase [Verrucomicrobiae bacterium]